jgi:GMC oxidoreductase
MIVPKLFILLLFTCGSGVVVSSHAQNTVSVPQLVERDNVTNPLLSGSPKYDYIIIGGGTAGLVLANRLSENSSVSVAVIEAGGYYEQENPTGSTVPALEIGGAGTDPKDINSVDWGFVTTPQAGARNRKLHYARGKCLGGTYA